MTMTALATDDAFEVCVNCGGAIKPGEELIFGRMLAAWNHVAPSNPANPRLCPSLTAWPKDENARLVR